MTVVIDTSAIVAILLNQGHWQRIAEVIIRATNPMMSSVSVYEASIVLLARKGPELVEIMHRFLESTGITIVEFTAQDARAAAAVYSQFGKGIHRASLNLGDCPVYQLAKQEKARLLFIGDDFSQTDIQPALELED